MPPKAILLDLDDTIVSFDGASERTWTLICSDFVERENPAFDSSTLLQTIYEVRRWFWGDPERHRIGRRDMAQARRTIVKTALNRLDYFDEEKIYAMADRYTQKQDESICLFPGARDALKAIQTMNLPMVLVTNGTTASQRGKIERFSLAGYFRFLLIEEETGYGKPDVRAFEYALEKLNLAASDVWMVGDNLVWDIQAPQSLGIYSVWNDWRKEGLPEGSAIRPDAIIHSIAELPALLDKE